MNDGHASSPHPSHAFWVAVTERIGRRRIHMSQSARSPGCLLIADTSVPLRATSHELDANTVWVTLCRSVHTFRNAWGFVVEVQSCPWVFRRRRVDFLSTVEVAFSVDIDPALGRMSHPGSFACEWSRRPAPHERAALERVANHNRDLTRALRAVGYRRESSTYSAPHIFRCPKDEDPVGVRESRAECASSWRYSTVEADDMACIVAGLMDLPLSVDRCRDEVPGIENSELHSLRLHRDVST